MRSFLCALLVLSLAAPLLADDLHPVFDSLRAYRSYVAVGKVGPMSHQFYVWFHDIEPHFCQVSGNTVEQMQGLSEYDLNAAWGGIALPPDGTDPVPPAVAPLADALLARLRVLYPEATDFQISYQGRFRRVHLMESIPTTRVGSTPRRIGLTIDTTVRLMPDGTIDGHVGFAGAGYGFLGYGIGGSAPDQLPKFVDFRMPAELEGTSVLYLPIFGRSAAYQDAYRALEAKVKDAVKAIDEGTYQNPIDQLLAAQGETVLPPGYSTRVTLRVSTHVRSTRTSEYPRFHFSVKEALAGPVTRTLKSDETGLTYDATMDLAQRSLALRVTNAAGDTAGGTWRLEPSAHHDGEIVVEGDSVGVLGGSLVAQIPDGEDELALPGVDVYPDASLFASFVNVPSELRRTLESKDPRGTIHHGARRR